MLFRYFCNLLDLQRLANRWVLFIKFKGLVKHFLGNLALFNCFWTFNFYFYELYLNPFYRKIVQIKISFRYHNLIPFPSMPNTNPKFLIFLLPIPIPPWRTFAH